MIVAIHRHWLVVMKMKMGGAIHERYFLVLALHGDIAVKFTGMYFLEAPSSIGLFWPYGYCHELHCTGSTCLPWE